MHAHTLSPSPFSATLELFPSLVYLILQKGLLAVVPLGLAIVPLEPAVVPLALAVVPLEC